MKPKILVIDDSIVLCAMISNILTENDYFVVTEVDANKGIDIAKVLMPDLILLDLVLKDADGYSICKDIKSNDVLKDIPILFITSTSDEDSIVRGFEVGAVDYIIKPFKKMELLARVKCHSTNKLLIDKNNKYAKKLEESLKLNKELATKDPLTNLYNRRYVIEQLTVILEKKCQNNSDYILIIDIDDFKSVNDIYGHNIGDEVIKIISSIIKDTSPYDSIVGRWGGEEIIVIFKNTEKYIDICELIRQKISDYVFMFNNQKFSKTVTIGCCRINYSKDIEENVSYADESLYIGKKNGKNKVVFFDSKEV